MRSREPRLQQMPMGSNLAREIIEAFKKEYFVDFCVPSMDFEEHERRLAEWVWANSKM